MSDRTLTAELTGMQAAFVVAYVETGGNGTEAAKIAGFSEKSARQQAHALINKPHIQAAIQIEQRKVLGRLANKSLAVIEAILDDKDGPAGVRLDASKTVLDRAGLTSKAAEGDAEKRGKRLNEMSVDELQEIVARGEAAARRELAA